MHEYTTHENAEKSVARRLLSLSCLARFALTEEIMKIDRTFERLAPSLTLLLCIAGCALAMPTRAEAQRVEVVRHRHVYLIAGVGGELGGFVDQATGLMGGAQVHVGVHVYGLEVYGLTQGFVGSIVGSPHGGTVEGLAWNSAMLGFGAGVFHLAAGPSLDFAWGCSDTSNGAGCYRGDYLLGFDARVALQFGHFEVSANVHPTLYGRSTVTGITVGVGWAY